VLGGLDRGYVEVALPPFGVGSVPGQLQIYEHILFETRAIPDNLRWRPLLIISIAHARRAQPVPSQHPHIRLDLLLRLLGGKQLVPIDEQFGCVLYIPIIDFYVVAEQMADVLADFQYGHDLPKAELLKCGFQIAIVNGNPLFKVTIAICFFYDPI
jgi:hypothetical protein